MHADPQFGDIDCTTELLRQEMLAMVSLCVLQFLSVWVYARAVDRSLVEHSYYNVLYAVLYAMQSSLFVASIVLWPAQPPFHCCYISPVMCASTSLLYGVPLLSMLLRHIFMAYIVCVGHWRFTSNGEDVLEDVLVDVPDEDHHLEDAESPVEIARQRDNYKMVVIIFVWLTEIILAVIVFLAAIDWEAMSRPTAYMSASMMYVCAGCMWVAQYRAVHVHKHIYGWSYLFLYVTMIENGVGLWIYHDRFPSLIVSVFFVMMCGCVAAFAQMTLVYCKSDVQHVSCWRLFDTRRKDVPCLPRRPPQAALQPLTEQFEIGSDSN